MRSRRLSGGNQQRIAIAKWLATDPKLLILDAPTVGVDVGARAGIFEIVAKLAESGLAIILISDEVPEVYFNADRVLHMAQGQHRQLVRSAVVQPPGHRGRRLCVSSFNPTRPNLRCSPSSRPSALVLSLTTDSFFSLGNAFDLLNTSSVNIIFAVGLLVVLIAGGIDISFAVAASVVQYVTALIARLDRRRRLDQRAPHRRQPRHIARRHSTPS